MLAQFTALWEIRGSVSLASLIGSRSGCSSGRDGCRIIAGCSIVSILIMTLMLVAAQTWNTLGFYNMISIKEKHQSSYTWYHKFVWNIQYLSFNQNFKFVLCRILSDVPDAKSPCQARKALPVTIIYTDIMGLIQFKKRTSSGFSKFGWVPHADCSIVTTIEVVCSRHN